MKRTVIIIAILLLAFVSESQTIMIKETIIDKGLATSTENLIPFVLTDYPEITEITFKSIDSYEKICFALKGDQKRCIGLNELYRMLVVRDSNNDTK